MASIILGACHNLAKLNFKWENFAYGELNRTTYIPHVYFHQLFCKRDIKLEFHVVYKFDLMESLLLNMLSWYSIQLNDTRIQLHLLRLSPL
jgi:hypothetical protein